MRPNSHEREDAMIAVDTKPALTLEEIRRLPGPERLAWVEQVRIFYPRWHETVAEIRRCHQMNTLAAEPQCLMLVGPTGAGKTTLIDSYTRDYPTRLTETSIQRPIVQATIPTPATVKNLETTLLDALGDPRAGQGTIGGMARRLINFFRDCRVELLILDGARRNRWWMRTPNWHGSLAIRTSWPHSLGMKGARRPSRNFAPF